LPDAAASTSAIGISLVMVSSGAFAAMDAEGSQLLVQVGAFDAECLRGARDVPVELGEPDADELALDLLAELAQALAGVAAEIDRGDRTALVRLAGLTRRTWATEIRRQIFLADHLVAHDDEALDDVA